MLLALLLYSCAPSPFASRRNAHSTGDRGPVRLLTAATPPAPDPLCPFRRANPTLLTEGFVPVGQRASRRAERPRASGGPTVTRRIVGQRVRPSPNDKQEWGPEGPAIPVPVGAVAARGFYSKHRAPQGAPSGALTVSLRRYNASALPARGRLGEASRPPAAGTAGGRRRFYEPPVGAGRQPTPIQTTPPARRTGVEDPQGRAGVPAASASRAGESATGRDAGLGRLPDENIRLNKALWHLAEALKSGGLPQN